MAAFATMLTNQQRETTALSEKLVKLELKNYLMTLTADGSLCPYKAGVAAPKVLSTTTNLAISQLYLGSAAAAPVVIEVGAAYSPEARNLIPAQMRLINIENPEPNYFRATLEVVFDENLLIRGLERIRVPVFFATDATDLMNSCLGESVTGLPLYRLTRWAGADGDVNTAAAPSCPLGYTLINWVPVSSYDNWSTVGICQLQ